MEVTEQIHKEVAKLPYVALKNKASFNLGCMPEDRSNKEMLKRALMINSTDFYVAAGEFFIDTYGIGRKLQERGARFAAYADEKDIKACSLIDPSTYVYEHEEQQPDGSIKKSGKVIGFRNMTQILEPATLEYYLATKHVGGGVATAQRIAKLEEQASEAEKLRADNEKLMKEREAFLKEREQMLAMQTEMKAKLALSKVK